MSSIRIRILYIQERERIIGVCDASRFYFCASFLL